MHKLLILAMTIMFVTDLAAKDAEAETKTVIESGGRTVTFTDEIKREHTGYDSPWHYAHAIRAGDFVYVSGVIIGAASDDELPISKERFRESTERVIEYIQKALATADVNLEGLTKINTFHKLDGKITSLTIDEQALVIAKSLAKYTNEPHPAWTAVGTTGLFSPLGIVEIEVVVYAPDAEKNR